MSELAHYSRQAAGAMTVLLRRVRSLAIAVAMVAALIGALTYLTGWWAFDGAMAWAIIGAVICFTPAALALVAAGIIQGASTVGPTLLREIESFLSTRRGGDDVSNVLLDLDSGIALASSSRTFGGLKTELTARRRELPALWLSVRAITLVPKLAAFTVLGMFGVGFLGFVLFLVAVVS
jgi:hypothetical protein